VTASPLPPTDIDVVLDLSGVAEPPADPGAVAQWWTTIEGALVGRVLGRGSRHSLVNGADEVVVDVMRTTAALVTERTRFGIVAIVSPPGLRYRCRECSAASRTVYGPYVCRTCADVAPDRSRLCEAHVVFLPGSLVSTCNDHAASCSELGCASPADLWCTGPHCRTRKAWCRRHARTNTARTGVLGSDAGSGPGWSDGATYCAHCYDDLFPTCSSRGCVDAGTIRCEHVDDADRPCGNRVCNRHGMRWQVYGPNHLGLGRCQVHRNVRVAATEVIRQIVLGTSRRRHQRLPTLASFAHILRRSGHDDLALDSRRIHGLLGPYGHHGRKEVREKVAQSERGWGEQVAAATAANHEGASLVARLKAILPQYMSPFQADQLAVEISLAQYKPPRPGSDRPGMLFVKVPESSRGLFIGPRGATINGLSAALGVKVAIEGGGRR
jgi:hypothetical protein